MKLAYTSLQGVLGELVSRAGLGLTILVLDVSFQIKLHSFLYIKVDRGLYTRGKGLAL